MHGILGMISKRLKDKILHDYAGGQGLSCISLAVSNLCGADCVFCPKKRGKNERLKNMPLDTVKKIADEISSQSFRSVHNVQKVVVGENGDALLNPDFIEILRYIKLKNPRLFVEVFTNFHNFRRDISEVIVQENLIDRLNVNIDGHDPEAYYRVKRIPFNVVKQNIVDFLETRRKYRSMMPLNVVVITFADYVASVYRRFGKLPVKVNESLNPRKLQDDFSLIIDQWDKQLNPKVDTCFRARIQFWAERELIPSVGKDASAYTCPNLKRIPHDCFIAPNGDSYLCCYDELQMLTVGNVVEKSISEVYHGEMRRRLINLLANKEFAEIGYPCSLVEACQSVPFSLFIHKVFSDLILEISKKGLSGILSN
jgi:MoaA/NifB/PqqE/SkfB family radical SAM enzyme